MNGGNHSSLITRPSRDRSEELIMANRFGLVKALDSQRRWYLTVVNLAATGLDPEAVVLFEDSCFMDVRLTLAWAKRRMAAGYDLSPEDFA